MRIINVTPKMDALLLGKQGENKSTKFLFDVSGWLEDYPGCSIGLNYRPAKSNISYPCILMDENNGKKSWLITSSELVNDGDGEAELVCILDEVVEKDKRTWKTKVNKSLGGSGTAPDPWENWEDTFIELAERAEDAAEDAEEAKEAAEAAAGVAAHAPIIQDGYWYTWDATTEQYVNSGEKAQGEDATPALIAVDYSELTFPVAEGKLCYHSGLLYKANQAIATSEEWTAAHWTQTTIEAEQHALLTEITQTAEQVETHESAIFEWVPDGEELVNIPLSFDSYGWWTNTRYYDTQDGQKAEVAVNAGEKYDVIGFSTWSFSPYVVIDEGNNILLTGTPSGSSTKVKREETITIPSGGLKLVFSSAVNDTTWQNACKCVKHVYTYKKESRLIVETDNQENVSLSWTDGKAYLSNGNALVDPGYSCDLVDVVPGDTYTFKYWSNWTVTYVLFDTDGNMISHGETSGSATWKSYEATITIPSNGSQLALSITSYRPSDQVTQSYVHHYFKTEVDLKDYVSNILTQQNVLYGKKWFATGDSFTHGSIVDPDEDPFFESGIYMGKRKTYPYFIGLRNNMTIINDGLSGSTIAEIKSGDSYETTPFCDASRYQSIPEDTDYITLWFGINDANHCNLGTISDSTGATFYGAWNVVLEWIVTNRPNAKIGIIVTNLSTETFREATREIAKKWGIPYLDMMGDYQVPVLIGGREDDLGLDSDVADIRTAHWRIASDNMHPTVAAHRYESTFIEAFLRRL